MKTITFYSYKGGVGRSLALANLANRLAEFGKKVCILDFDLEAPGMHLKFEANLPSQGVQEGLVDYIYELSNNHIVPSDITNYVTPIIFDNHNNKCNIDLIAAGNPLSKSYWKKLSSISWKDFFYEKDAIGVPFFYNLKEQIRQQIQPDFLLIDSRTGITDISGVTMSIFADEVVLLAANNRENLEGIAQVLRTLAIPENSIGLKIPKINFVLCRLPFFANPRLKARVTLAQKRAQNSLNNSLKAVGIENLHIAKVLVIHSDPDLEIQEQFKIGYDDGKENDGTSIPIGLDYLELFKEITSDVITEDEYSRFNNYLKAEALIQKAIASNVYIEKVQGFEAALDINPQSETALFQLANTYHDFKQYDKALHFVNKAMDVSRGRKLDMLSLLGSIYFDTDKMEEAKKTFEEILEIEAGNHFATNNLGLIYHRSGKLMKALEIQQNLIKTYPDEVLVWNNYANTLRGLKKFDEAFDAVYKALEIDPQDAIATGTLAEIYADQGNLREFYKNLELSFSFGMTSEDFGEVMKIETVYRQFRNDEKFLAILEKYDIAVESSH